MAARRHPEDSVVASIDQVRAMLREEAAPAGEADDDGAERATVVTHRAALPYASASERSAEAALPVAGVPTAAEVAASRAARWADDAASVEVVRSGARRVSGWRVLAAVAVVVGAASIGAWAWWTHRAPAEAAAGVVAAGPAVAPTAPTAASSPTVPPPVARSLRLTAALAVAQARLAAQAVPEPPARAPASSVAAASASEPPAPAPAKRRRARRTPRRQARSLLVRRPRGPTAQGIKAKAVAKQPRVKGPRAKRRAKRPLTRQDRRLDALINGL